MADWFPSTPPIPVRPALWRGGVGCVSDSPLPSQRTQSKGKASPNENPFIPFSPPDPPHLQSPDLGRSSSSTVPTPAHPGLGTRPAPRSRSPQRVGVSRPSHQRPKPAELPGPGRSMQPRPPRQAGPGGPQPPHLPPAARHTTRAHKTLHVCGRGAVRANSPLDPRGKRGRARARRERGGTPWHRCERGGASVTHLMK